MQDGKVIYAKLVLVQVWDTYEVQFRDVQYFVGAADWGYAGAGAGWDGKKIQVLVSEPVQVRCRMGRLCRFQETELVQVQGAQFWTASRPVHDAVLLSHASPVWVTQPTPLGVGRLPLKLDPIYA